jgi:hypothetical protein
MAHTKKPCPGCKEVHPYRGADDLCAGCERLLEDGRKYQADLAKTSPALRHYVYSEAFYGYPGYGEESSRIRRKESASDRARKALVALIESLSRTASVNVQCRKWGQDQAPLVIKAMTREMSDWMHVIRMNPEHARLLNELDAAFRDVAHDTYEAGREYGQSLIASLARGESTISDWNEATMGGRD